MNKTTAKKFVWSDNDCATLLKELHIPDTHLLSPQAFDSIVVRTVSFDIAFAVDAYLVKKLAG